MPLIRKHSRIYGEDTERAQGCLNERMLAGAWISWLPCFVFTNSLNGSLSLNYERERERRRWNAIESARRRDATVLS